MRAAVVTIAAFLVLAACLFGGAGQIAWPMAWATLAIYAGYKVAAFAFVDRDLMRERAAPGPGVDRWDVVLATLGYIGLFPCTFLVGGLDAVRFGPAVRIHQLIQLTALVVFALGQGFAFWAVLANPYFSTFLRIQDDRGHAVVSVGPYMLLRHPGYAGVMLAHLALPLALGSMWALAPATLGAGFFVARTAREDRMLGDRLHGYQAYQALVRWRLVPGVW